jgi:hypothetical protein
MLPILRIVFATMAVVALANSNAYALCGGDYWGGRTSFLTKLSETSISITAVSSIHHPAGHTNCGGQIFTKAVLKRAPLTMENSATGVGPKWKRESRRKLGTV